MSEPRPESGSMTRRIAAGTGWVIAWRVATRNLGLISTLILVRLLDPADFGLVALATAFTATVDALSMLGVQDALLREPNPDRAMYDSAFGISVLRGGATALLIAACAGPCAAFFNEPRLLVVLLALAAGAFVSAFENIGIVDFRRDMAFQKEFHLQVVGRVVGVGVTIGLAWLWRDYWALVAGLLATRLIRLGQSYVMSRYRPRFTIRAWRRLIGFSLWTWGITMVGQVRDRADSFVIGRAMTTADVAGFSVGQEIGSLPVTELIEPLYRTLFSAFSLVGQEGRGGRDLLLNAIEAGFLLLLPAGVGISLIADPVVHLMLGERWVAVIPVVQILAAASTITVFGTIASAMNAADGRVRTNFRFAMMAAMIKVPLLLLLVGWYGLAGAAVAVAITMLAEHVLLTRVTLRHLGIAWPALLLRLWRSALACLAMVAVLYAAGFAWTPGQGQGIWGMAEDVGLRAALGAATYATTLLLAWLAAGRPEGAEQYFLTIAGKMLRRVRR